MSILYAILMLILFLMGLTLIPAMSFFIRDGVPKSMAEQLVYIHLCLVHLAWGGSALIQRSYGYELVPLRVDGEDVRVYLDGTWETIQATPGQIDGYAFGLFTLLVERGEHLDVFTADAVPQTDGGTAKATLNEERVGIRAFDASAATENQVSKADGPKIDLAKVADALRGANAERLAASGRQKALLEHGSVLKRGGTIFTIVFAFLALILGGATVFVAGMM